MTTEQEGWGSQLRKGVLELAVLGLLAREPMYGSQLVDELAARPELAITAGILLVLVGGGYAIVRLASPTVVVTEAVEGPVVQALRNRLWRGAASQEFEHQLALIAKRLEAPRRT